MNKNKNTTNATATRKSRRLLSAKHCATTTTKKRKSLNAKNNIAQLFSFLFASSRFLNSVSHRSCVFVSCESLFGFDVARFSCAAFLALSRFFSRACNAEDFRIAMKERSESFSFFFLFGFFLTTSEITRFSSPIELDWSSRRGFPLSLFFVLFSRRVRGCGFHFSDQRNNTTRFQRDNETNAKTKSKNTTFFTMLEKATIVRP